MTSKISSSVSQHHIGAEGISCEEKRGKKRARDEAFDSLPKELFNAIKDVYQPAGMEVTNAYTEEESKDYGACRLKLDSREVVFRVAKTTPKKVGQFVTVWQRPHAGAAYVPFNERDQVDFIAVSVADDKNIGQFVFNRRILIDQGIMGTSRTRGKGAFRVYSPWVRPENKTALKTQEWQKKYFFSQKTLDLGLVRNLFKLATKV